MRSNQLLNTLSKLQLKDKVVFGNRDKYDYYIDLSKTIKGFHKDIKQRLESIEPDAVYFFNAQPLILFFDISQNKRDLGELYKKVWSFDNTSVIFIIQETEIKVFNALNYLKKQKSLEKITLSEQEIEKLFNLWELESGNTWKWFQNNYLKTKNKKDYQKRVNKKLFSNIKKVREDLKDKSLTENEANSLILRLIFIRYLIDRKIKIHDKLISGKVDDLNERRKSFIQLINQPKKLNELFKILNNRFNGVLFKETDFVLSSQQAEYLSNVFSGEIPEKNTLFDGFFFEIFDFSIIPVEVISGIYESLIDEEKRKLDSAVYTPSFLVDYILKDTVDEFLKTNKPEDCTVFEVAVGSGIFLVQSLRRIIEKEIKLNGNKDNKAFAEKIKSFAENNLYGIDINEQALNVTCFSIYIALLDYLEPADINKYKFPQLIGKNLFKSNFFGKFDNKKLIPADFETTINKVKPKFILGNPPWKKDKSKEHLNWVNSTKTYNKKIKGELEIAQSFLLRTKEFMQENTICSLIVTSTIFYNVSTTAKEFKTDFLTSFCLNNFFDLSPVRRLIFEKKNSPATVVTYKLSQDKDFNKNVVNHQSVKSNIFLKNFKILVIEKFDQNEILQKHFIENDWMFKVALYGNTLDYYFLKRFFDDNEKTVLDKVDNKKLFASSGILKGTREKKFDFLIGLPVNENSSVNKYYTLNSSNLLERKDVFLEAGRDIENFNGNKILFKEQAENESELVISLNENASVYKKGIFGLCSTDGKTIEHIYPFLISKLYEYFIFSISGSWGTSTRPQIRWKEEYLSFPIKETDNKIQKDLLKYSNKLISDIKEYYKNQPEKSDFELKPTNESKSPINQTALNQINNLINEIYDVREHEKDLIDYVLNVSRYQFQETKQHLLTYKVDKEKEFLKQYAEVYLKEFSEIYTDEFIQVQVFLLEHFIAMNFVMKSKEPKETVIYSESKDAESVLRTLANTLSISEVVNTSDPTKNLYIQKDIRGFEENSFYIIKPNEYKSWHRAMAWYDVSEFKEAIQKAEINELNINAE